MRFLGRKLLRLVFVVVAVTTLTFLMVNLLPGDIAYLIGGMSATPAEIEAIRRELGLDQPLWWRYLDWVAALLQGDFGISLRTSEPVAPSGRSRRSMPASACAAVIRIPAAAPPRPSASASARQSSSQTANGTARAPAVPRSSRPKRS